MIIPDINLPIYAHNTGVSQHESARRWWESSVNGTERVGIPWAIVIGFVRLMTNPRVVFPPVNVANAVGYVEEWFARPGVVPVNPGVEHLAIFRRNLEAAGVGGNLVTDCHIATLAMEYQAELHSNDTDFSRFPGLRWRNPLTPP